MRGRPIGLYRRTALVHTIEQAAQPNTEPSHVLLHVADPASPAPMAKIAAIRPGPGHGRVRRGPAAAALRRGRHHPVRALARRQRVDHECRPRGSARGDDLPLRHGPDERAARCRPLHRRGRCGDSGVRVPQPRQPELLGQPAVPDRRRSQRRREARPVAERRRRDLVLCGGHRVPAHRARTPPIRRRTAPRTAARAAWSVFSSSTTRRSSSRSWERSSTATETGSSSSGPLPRW